MKRNDLLVVAGRRSALNHLMLCLFLASNGSSVLAGPISLPNVEAPDKETIPVSPTANTKFTPLMLPKDAAERGISLSGDTKLSRVENGKYHMGCGTILVHTEEPIYISTCRANIFVRSGATIVVGAKQDVTRVLNLSDHKRDSVRVIFGDKHIALNPGEELGIVCATASNADKAATEEVVRFRNAQSIAVSPEYKAVLFEFSLADAMKHCLIFRQLKESPFKRDKVLLNEIIKTAAAVNTLFIKARGQYTHGESTTVATKNGNARVSRVSSKRKPSARIAQGNLSEIESLRD